MIVKKSKNAVSKKIFFLKLVTIFFFCLKFDDESFIKNHYTSRISLTTFSLISNYSYIIELVIMKTAVIMKHFTGELNDLNEK